MNKLAELREDYGLTQKQLGEKLGVSGKAVQAWENDRNTPKPAMMQRLEDFFETPKEDIFFGAFDYKM